MKKIIIKLLSINVIVNNSIGKISDEIGVTDPYIADLKPSKYGDYEKIKETSL